MLNGIVCFPLSPRRRVKSQQGSRLLPCREAVGNPRGSLMAHELLCWESRVPRWGLCMTAGYAAKFPIWLALHLFSAYPKWPRKLPMKILSWFEIGIFMSFVSLWVFTGFFSLIDFQACLTCRARLGKGMEKKNNMEAKRRCNYFLPHKRDSLGGCSTLYSIHSGKIWFDDSLAILP